MKRPWPQILFPLLVLLAGCATAFTGDANFPGGPRGCMDKCAGSGLVMSAFVYMGEYSSGCVCQPRTQTSSAGDSASAIAAAAGVMTQMREAQNRQTQMQSQPLALPPMH